MDMACISHIYVLHSMGDVAWDRPMAQVRAAHQRDDPHAFMLEVRVSARG